MDHPRIIQGGMGIAVSDWKLAQAVASYGELGVVSGTALPVVMIRRLQLGDSSGAVRRALDHFPSRAVAERIIADYFVAGGIPAGQAFKLSPMPTLQPSKTLQELTVAACFVEVFLAKEGHQGKVGINLLEKIQMPTLASLYGAMLAGVDYVLMGAGIPRQIPGILDQFARGDAAELKIDVEGASADTVTTQRFDPRDFLDGMALSLRRPYFLAIVSSATLALTLAKKSSGKVDGFVIEGALAGGHNAPPRGSATFDTRGQPVYGPRDVPDLVKFRELGLPFWLAGSYARTERLTEALSLGAAGVQIGTAFAFCRESGMTSELKRAALRASATGGISLFTDPKASPTGFPFKVAELNGTVATPEVYEARERICDIGLLRQPFVREDGTIGYRCAAEPVDAFCRKGGAEEDTEGRKCLCNGLAATVGVGQRRAAGPEPALVTAGQELTELTRFLAPGHWDYSARDVIRSVRGEV